jgi:hypothetical protein
VALASTTDSFAKTIEIEHANGAHFLESNQSQCPIEVEHHIYIQNEVYICAVRFPLLMLLQMEKNLELINTAS